ncbi:MAG: invasion associated locus B family protein [Rhodobacterales bacterium]|nr:invasion associated locus B family protein [Rhodobacterales bacterium]
MALPVTRGALGAAISAIAIFGFGAVSPVLAQSASTNQVAAKTAWSVFTETSPRECWTVSAPTKTVNSKDGKVVEVRRGEILLMTFFRPDAGVRGQVAFTGGYPFADGSTIEVDVGGTKFQLYSEKEWAWPASADDDAKIIAALKRGSEVVLTGRSGRGTQTKDTFSLIGYTAAMEEAQKRCQ